MPKADLVTVEITFGTRQRKTVRKWRAVVAQRPGGGPALTTVLEEVPVPGEDDGENAPRRPR